MDESILNKILAKVNPYIQRYCENKYRTLLKEFISVIISSVPADELNEKEYPHHLAYDYKHLVTSAREQVLKNKSASFIAGFYENFMKLIRGGYIDEVQNGNLDKEKKILLGKFFIVLIDTISLIEGVNADDYIKFKEHVKKENKILATTTTESNYYYWKYPLSYLKQFEELLLKYEYIEKHANFNSVFMSQAITSREEELIKFKGTRPELWYMLFRIYKNKLNFQGILLHKVASNLFVFVGKENTSNVTNTSWQKFQEHIDGATRDEQYIQKKLANPQRLIEELKLPQ